MMLTHCLLLLRDAVSISRRKLGRRSWLGEIAKLFRSKSEPCTVTARRAVFIIIYQVDAEAL